LRADLILAGGRIRPLGRHGLRPVTHLAIRDGRVLAAGGHAVMDFRGTMTRVVRLRGAAVFPGFDDAHCHVVYHGLSSFGADLVGTRSIPELQDRLRRAAAKLPAGTWLQGRGYFERDLAEGRPPTREELDAATGDRPAFVDHRGGHSRVANTAALAAAGLDGSSPDPPGGRLGRTADGNLDGLLSEAAMRLVADVQPPPPLAQREEGVLRAQRLLLSRGVTSVGAAVNRGFADDLRAYARLQEAGKLHLRVNEFLSLELLDPAIRLGLATRSGSHRLRAGPVKVFVDGGAASGTAAFRGRPAAWRTPPEELVEIVRRAHRAGLQVATHCVGDAAVEAMIAAVEAAQAEDGRVLRHRVEHCTVCPPDLRSRMAAAGMVAVMQPLFGAFARERRFTTDWPVDPADLAPHRELLRAGVGLAFSSDLPFTSDVNPWAGIAAAAADGDAPVTPLAALTAYTAGGAWTSFEENVKGTLEPDRVADFQVYDVDPLTLPVGKWKGSRPRLVAIAGSPVFRRSGG
jgi:predicted amidohydrolase YtcJ